jgi:hypothetical protein
MRKYQICIGILVLSAAVSLSLAQAGKDEVKAAMAGKAQQSHTMVTPDNLNCATTPCTEPIWRPCK